MFNTRQYTRGARRGAVIALIVSCLGCAQLAKKTPTPAADVTAAELDRLPTPPGERYYALMFGSETLIGAPRKTHTWATVVRVVDHGDGTPALVEPHTISWMPATLAIRPWHFRVEPGTNLDLHQSIETALCKRERIAMWGPFELRPGIFRKFVMQKSFMESGQVGYQCVDTAGEAARCGNGCDCIHAITDADGEFDRGNYWLFRYGHRASRFIVDQVALRDGFINQVQTHDWLIKSLAIDQYPIERRCASGPRLTSVAWAQLQKLRPQFNQ